MYCCIHVLSYFKFVPLSVSMSPGVSSYGGLARSSPEPPGMYPRPKNLVRGAWEKASYSPVFMLTLCSQGKDSCSSFALRETHIDSFQKGAVQKKTKSKKKACFKQEWVIQRPKKLFFQIQLATSLYAVKWYQGKGLKRIFEKFSFSGCLKPKNWRNWCLIEL